MRNYQRITAGFTHRYRKKHEAGLDDVVKNAKDPKDAVAIIKEHGELLKGQNKK